MDYRYIYSIAIYIYWFLKIYQKQFILYVVVVVVVMWAVMHIIICASVGYKATLCQLKTAVISYFWFI